MNDTSKRRRDPSGRFLLRVSPGLHAALRRGADEAGLSLNDYCIRKLVAPGGVAEGSAGDVVARAAGQFGEDLRGVLVFGSWARGDASDESDVDLLVVVDRSVGLVRSLYRAWDSVEPALTWDERPREVHFVHMPKDGGTPSGLWAEAALDGVVLFDPGLALSRHLAEIRRGIASGEVQRRILHGQPYWVGG